MKRGKGKMSNVLLSLYCLLLFLFLRSLVSLLFLRKDRPDRSLHQVKWMGWTQSL